MGVAYYIALDLDDVSLDGINGKYVAKAMDELTDLADELGIQSLESFMGQSAADFSDLIGEDIEVDDAEIGDATWFEPLDGIATIDALVSALAEDPKRIKGAASVQEDLADYKRALEKAAEAGARWHLAIDI
ncbi:MAG: hypothetical protein RLZZ618_2472 [Pseudomonadota bacterium]|jgi:hypothetical protein